MTASPSFPFLLEKENVKYHDDLPGYLVYPIIKNNTKEMDKKLSAIVMIH